MHYNISYKGLSPQAAHDKAIADIREYMGSDRFETLTAQFARHEPMPLEVFELIVSFAGVQGFPVKAWHNECWPYAKAEA
jgi:hypothetical protein